MSAWRELHIARPVIVTAARMPGGTIVGGAHDEPCAFVVVDMEGDAGGVAFRDAAGLIGFLASLRAKRIEFACLPHETPSLREIIADARALEAAGDAPSMPLTH